jgi:membrane-associated phospholipid phosphatase
LGRRSAARTVALWDASSTWPTRPLDILAGHIIPFCAMPTVLARSVDTRTLAATAALVGRSRLLDRLVTLLAEHLAKLHIALLVLLLMGGQGPRGRQRRATGLRIAVALPVTILTVGVVGRLVDRERPFSRHEHVTPLIEHTPSRSFPSRHSACAAAMATIALPSVPAAGWLMALGALGLGVSRVYAGLHYPSDIVAGWLIGAVIGIIARQKEFPGVSWP